MVYENPLGHGASARWSYGNACTTWRSGPTVSGVSKRVSAEDQIETIVEQARVAEAASTNRMAFLQDVSVLCLVGLRQLAKEIDRLDRGVDVVANGQASPGLPKLQPSNGSSSPHNWVTSHRKLQR